MKKGQRFRTQFDPSYKGSTGIKIKGKSQTLPDLNMSVQQLMQNHTRGMEIPQAKDEYYEEDLGGEVPSIVDLVDLEEMKEENLRKQKELENTIKKEKDEFEAKRKADKLNQKANDELSKNKEDDDRFGKRNVDYDQQGKKTGE